MWVQSLGRGYPGVGNDNRLQYSCPKNFVDRGAWTVQGFTKSWTQLSACIHSLTRTHTHTHTHTRVFLCANLILSRTDMVLALMELTEERKWSQAVKK